MAEYGPKQKLQGPEVRVEFGTPTEFLSQQKGLVDTYLSRDGDELIEIMPIDKSKFQHHTNGMTIGLTVQDMPWYFMGYFPNADEDPMYSAMIQMLNDAVDELEAEARVEEMEIAENYVFGKRLWDHVLNRVKNMFHTIVISERPRGVDSRAYAVGLNRTTGSKANVNLNLYGNEIEFTGYNGATCELTSPLRDQPATYKRNAAYFDAKLRMLIAWALGELFDTRAVAHTTRISLAMRMLGPDSARNIISKLALGMVPMFEARHIAVMAVFEECVAMLFEAESQYVEIAHTTELLILPQNENQKHFFQKPEVVMQYFGGNLDVRGSGSKSYGWLINGCRESYDGTGNVDFALIGIDDYQDEKVTPFNKVQQSFQLHEEVWQTPFKVGAPTQVSGNIILAEEDLSVDAYPFRAHVVGGVITHPQKSFFDERRSEKIIHIPKVSPLPRAPFTAEGVYEVLVRGNISEFKGETGLAVGCAKLDSGQWVR